MTENKCKWCQADLSNPRAKFCSDKCRMNYKRHGVQPEQPEQADPNKTAQPEQNPPEQTTRTGIDPNNRTQPEQPLDSQAVDSCCPGAEAGDCSAGRDMDRLLMLAECRHVKNAEDRGKNEINLGDQMTKGELPSGVVNRVSLPGDPDYTGVCREVDGVWVAA